MQIIINYNLITKSNNKIKNETRLKLQLKKNIQQQ